MSQTLHTQRLTLRTPCAADIPHVQTAMENHAVNQWVEMAPWPYLPNSAEWFINHMLPKITIGDSYMWSITERTSGEFLGLIEYGVKENNKAGRGFWLKQEAWNKGYMEEATTATLDYIFNQTPITLVEASNAKSNAGSRKVKLKNGFTLFELRNVELRPGKVQDPIQEVYHLTKADWQSRMK